MGMEYIPVASVDTKYFQPQTEQELDEMFEGMNVGDMIFSKWVFDGIWFVMGLIDKNDPTTKCLFPNILMDEPLQPLKRWGNARLIYLREHNPFLATQFGTVGLHRHCLEIEEQAEQRKRNMMLEIRKDPANQVTEKDKALDPIAWAGRMGNFQSMVHETIYADLIFS